MNDTGKQERGARLILGLDASTVSTGWALLSAPRAGQKTTGRARRPQTRLIAYGALAAKKSMGPVDRLLSMAARLEDLIAEHRPTEVAIESAFVFLNNRTALSLGEVRGALLLTAARAGLQVFQYPPKLIKQQIAGHGNATKQQVAEAVRLMLDINVSGMVDDTTDAIACALTHAAETEQTSKGLPRSTFTRRRHKRPSKPPKTGAPEKKR